MIKCVTYVIILNTRETEMAKRTFIVCAHKGQNYKLYTEDIKKINRKIKKPTPKLPLFESTSTAPQWEDIEEVEF